MQKSKYPIPLQRGYDHENHSGQEHYFRVVATSLAFPPLYMSRKYPSTAQQPKLRTSGLWPGQSRPLPMRLRLLHHTCWQMSIPLLRELSQITIEGACQRHPDA
jgi:hypothetical protein